MTKNELLKVAALMTVLLALGVFGPIWYAAFFGISHGLIGPWFLTDAIMAILTLFSWFVWDDTKPDGD